MKAYELMAKLAEAPCSMEVCVTAYPGGTTNILKSVTIEDDLITLEGDGEFRDDLDQARREGHLQMMEAEESDR